ncbi:hypothetical protein [Hyalangium minutum]|uniref:Lipoprotein n=1 Tax=Hyalangium minutum TaxID=394096 RepID=A0A085VXK0_9BACT|nr:hypothetical protein [Hyalangium minutum]KFE60163.1 hypothetical protein DB31_6034 [Hyalangium minutum]
MTLRRWSRALLAALVLAGCKSEKPAATPAPEPSAPAAATPPQAPPPAPTAPAAPPAPTPAPAAGPTVSYLSPSDPERCQWVRQSLPASGEPTVLFVFNAACDRSMVSWSPDGKEGVVFTWPSGEGEQPKAWRVDLVAHTGKALDLKTLPGGVGAGDQDKPAIEQISFDKKGQVVALVTDIYVTRKTKKGPGGKTVLTFEGKSYALPEGVEGSPGLAHAYRLEDGAWKHLETKASGFESDLAPGTRELDTVKTLQPVANASVSSDRMVGDDAPEAAVKKLDAAFPGQDESGQWMQVSTPGGTVYYRGSQGGEYLYPSVPVAWEQGGKLVEVEGLLAKKDDFLGIQTQDAFLLISNYGDPHSVQVWDTKTKERVLSAEGASAPAFWPKPAGP